MQGETSQADSIYKQEVPRIGPTVVLNSSVGPGVGIRGDHRELGGITIFSRSLGFFKDFIGGF